MPTPRLLKFAKGGGFGPWKTPLTEGAHVIARHVLQSPNGDTQMFKTFTTDLQRPFPRTGPYSRPTLPRRPTGRFSSRPNSTGFIARILKFWTGQVKVTSVAALIKSTSAATAAKPFAHPSNRSNSMCTPRSFKWPRNVFVKPCVTPLPRTGHFQPRAGAVNVRGYNR